MTWQPMARQWPQQKIKWLAGLDTLKEHAAQQQRLTNLRLAKLESTAHELPVTSVADDLLSKANQSLTQHFEQAPACLVLTPFQPGIGQGQGKHRFLSANNLLDQLGNHLLDAQATRHEDHYALAIMILAASPAELATSLATFNTLLPLLELQRCERRARLLATLENEKWHKPVAAPLPQWGTVALAQTPVVREAHQALRSQLRLMETSVAAQPPLHALQHLAERKVAHQQATEQRLAAAQGNPANTGEVRNVQVRRVGPGNLQELRRQLLEGDKPGHEWIMCAGAILVGDQQALACVSELVGL
ncbi:hypothetical protein RAM80_08335 [Pseudomonas sp. App30]|uniref:hypothetical protein n=1 Tax=Pseudomonas sp. App30 TaxID=3068990 RepID=UPI003A80D6A3